MAFAVDVLLQRLNVTVESGRVVHVGYNRSRYLLVPPSVCLHFVTNDGGGKGRDES